MIRWLTALALAGCVLAPSASATFPGRDGEIALAVNHDPWVLGVARISPTAARPVNVELASTNFYYGCVINQGQNPRERHSHRACAYDDRGYPEGGPDPSFSPDGRTLILGLGNGISEIGTDGSSHLLRIPGGAQEPAWFPDGHTIVYQAHGALFTLSTATGTTRRLIGDATGPDVSPTGRLIAFTRHRAIWLVNADGSGARRLLASAEHPTFSPDGKEIAFDTGYVVPGADGGYDEERVETIPVTGGTPHRIHEGEYPIFSPDGKSIAYDINDVAATNESALWVEPVAGGTPHLLALDNPISEDETEFDGISWQPLGG